MPSARLMQLNGLTAEDFQPHDRIGEVEAKQDATKQDVDMLADTVLALCDIIEGGEQ